MNQISMNSLIMYEILNNPMIHFISMQVFNRMRTLEN